MPKPLSDFAQHNNLSGVYSATKGTLRCTAITLKDGSLCLFSPVSGLNDNVKDSINKLGSVSYLLAPNHYHNKGLVEYSDAFPEAKLVAPDLAIPRLQKVTGLSFANLVNLEGALSNNHSIIHSQGLKTGEIWLKIIEDTEVTWVVVDAFCTMKDNAKKPVSDTPQILGTFPKMGVQDVNVYLPWVRAQIDQDNPTSILPCHGSAIQSPQLPKKLKTLLKETFE